MFVFFLFPNANAIKVGECQMGYWDYVHNNDHHQFIYIHYIPVFYFVLYYPVNIGTEIEGKCPFN